VFFVGKTSLNIYLYYIYIIYWVALEWSTQIITIQ